MLAAARKDELFESTVTRLCRQGVWNIGGIKKLLFSMAGKKFDKMAEKQGKEYRFIFVRSDGEQLKKVTEIVQKYSIKPPVDSHSFSIDQANEAMKLVAGGKLNGKVVIRF